MVKRKYFLLLFVLLLMASSGATARSWTLNDCINYALQNNTTIQKNTLTRLSAIEDIKQSQASLLPSLSVSTNQSGSFTPWPESGRATVTNGYVQTSVDKVYYNGMYGVDANWTVWDGGKNINTVKLNKLAVEKAKLDSATTANSLIEQIAQLYVQILYSTEAIKVNKESLTTSKTNEERGKEMVRVGKMSKTDLAQLTAQRAQDEYNIVSSESTLKDYKRQLKQLLQITSDEDFDVTLPTTTDDMALTLIPLVSEVYALALENRPEIKSAQLGIDQSELNIKIAKAGKMPTVGLSASASTNTSSMSEYAWGSQLKQNFALGAGVSISVPLFDNRSTKTSVNKAKLQQQEYRLTLKEEQQTLYSTIENYWLQANNNQSQFRAAKVSSESAQESYNLLQEQFRLGLKNIVELMTGKDNLLTAKQNELQSKYLAILNINMLNFYKNGTLK